jgi:hypothetical protein
MRRIFVLALMMIGAYTSVSAQELYVFTEPASNMPTKSIGVRITNEGMFNYPGYVSRTIPEVMIGFNKNLMMHAQAFLSDMDGKYRLEGGSLYAKYRFLSLDKAHSHFRASAFGRISTSRWPTYTRDINLEGDNSGVQGGLIFTQLLHKLALSSTLGYANAFENSDRQIAGMSTVAAAIRQAATARLIRIVATSFPLIGLGAQPIRPKGNCQAFLGPGARPRPLLTRPETAPARRRP